MRVKLVGLLAGLLVGSLLAAPGSAEPHSGTYDVTAIPLGTPYVPVPGVYCEGGAEGVHMDTRRMTAPAAGLLNVALGDHPGDWDVGIYDDLTDRWIGFGGYNSPAASGDGERAFARVRAGQKVRVVVCNYLSQQHTVQVSYRFDRGLVPPRTTPTKGFRHLAVGRSADLREKVPVNVVLVGFDPRDVKPKELVAALPKVNRPVERAPQWYGYQAPVGITYTYDYRVAHAGRDWTDRFFRRLRTLAEPAPLTIAQQLYNKQTHGVRDIERNHEIAAPDVERYLALNPPPGVDTSRHTVFLLNWWGRKDFVDHVYTKFGEPNTDTGEDLAAASSIYRLVAWGGSAYDDPETGLGTPRRVWFHDLSAGPDQWTDAHVVDTADVDGDGVVDRRLPPTWEYDDGFRTRADLVTDLGDLVRYVAVDLLFTPSPLYRVALTPPALPRSVDIDVNRYEHDALARPIGEMVDLDEMSRNVSRLLRYEKVTADDQELDTDRPSHLACYGQLVAAYQGASGPACERADRYLSYANPFVDEMSGRDRFIDDEGKVDYEVPVFLYSLSDRSSPGDSCFAYADDNQRDGTQSQVVAFLPAWCRRYIGGTDITIHELGHHFSLSHPHDGVDYEKGTEYGAWGEHSFAGLGDQVSSVMSYMWLNNEFSQFDYDNLDRFTAAANVTAAQQVAASVLRSSRAGAAARALRSADAHLGRTAQHFAAHRYPQAAASARAAYAAVRAAASAAGVTVTGSDAGWRVDDKAVSVPLPRERGYGAVDRVEIGADGQPYFCRLTGKTLTPYGPVEHGSALGREWRS